MEDYGETMSDKELEANISLLSIVDDHLPPSSPLLSEQKQQEMVETVTERKKMSHSE